jgi:hypothetical protein
MVDCTNGGFVVVYEVDLGCWTKKVICMRSYRMSFR